MRELSERLGPDPFAADWQWGNVHRTAPAHPLSEFFSDHAVFLDPPSMTSGGDGDTPQAASYSPAAPFTISSTSVLRYVYDLADWENSRWIVPLGASGNPASPHYSDQAEAWSRVEFIPMTYDWRRLTAEAAHQQTLEPS